MWGGWVGKGGGSYVERGKVGYPKAPVLNILFGPVSPSFDEAAAVAAAVVVAVVVALPERAINPFTADRPPCDIPYDAVPGPSSPSGPVSSAMYKLSPEPSSVCEDGGGLD